MKFRNIKANIIEETTNEALVEMMKNAPEVYQPIIDVAKPAEEVKAPEPEAPKPKTQKRKTSKAKKK